MNYTCHKCDEKALGYYRLKWWCVGHAPHRLRLYMEAKERRYDWRWRKRCVK